ncbi:protein prkA [Sulfobacillus harzensis]|uniref:Protein prkA n=1 Tax=Sulfobacillus harzensis TaxID=2729629 RepID=A0A7Y0Q3S3_9FIRM|nr:protein prkA [Sulfobacillus harzensis]NMP24573.1 protein prkA [Sulfobacillus harzensis]
MQDLMTSFNAPDPTPWTGTFQQYLDQVQATPQITDSAHRRLYRMIMAAGPKDSEGRYPFFADHLFGMDETIRTLVEDYLRPSALGFEVKKRILLLVGPVSGGKSTLVWLLKRGLEAFSRTDAGALYGIQGCPMHEDPLHLVPHALRPTLSERLEVAIDGELCPWCRYQLERVHHGRFQEMMVERVILSEGRRVGIGTYAPSDPKSQDISELTGSVDFHAISQYGSESDPRAFRFDGELNIANRGLMEFQEMLKLDEKFLYHLLSLSQEGNFKTGRYELISADEVIVGHTNEHEYKSFVQNPRNEALISRLFVLPVPYNLDPEAEVKIYEKLIRPHRSPEVHIAPWALETAAAISILSRIEESPKPGGDRLTKFQLYYDKSDKERYQALRRDGWLTGEGLRGLDPRFMLNRLAALTANPDRECIDASDVLKSVTEGIERDPFMDKAERSRMLEWVGMAREWYDRKVEETVLEAFAHDWSDELANLYHNYVDNVVLAVRQGPGGRSDQALLRSIEERMGISELQAAAFREEIYTRMEIAKKQNRVVSFLDHAGLHRALREKLLDDMRDEVKITTQGPVPDRRTLEKIEAAVASMVASGGYCPRCASKAIHHVGSLLNR